MRTSLIATSLALGLFAATSAQAAPVTTWGYSVDTVWTAASFTSGGGSQSVTPSLIDWGNPAGNLITNPNGGRSGVGIIDTAVPGATVNTNGAIAPTATFYHVNNVLDGSYATLRTASVLTTLSLTPVNPAGLPFPPDDITFNINFAETSNNGNCVVGATSNCDDVFVITFGSLNNSFTYDGNDYFVSIVKTNGPLNPLHPTACAAAGAAAGCLGFLTAENTRTDVEFGIAITSRPVQIPEPGILGLLGLGMLGLFLSRRRTAA